MKGIQDGPTLPYPVPVKPPPKKILVNAVLLAILAALMLFIGVTMAAAPIITDGKEPVGISIVRVKHDDGSVSTTTMTTAPLSACSDAYDCRQWVMDACGMNGRDAATYSYGSDGAGGWECVGTCKGAGKMTVEHVCPMKLSHRQTAIEVGD